MQLPARVWRLLKRASVCCYEDGCLGVAKAAAYSGLLSFIPVLTALATILVQMRAEQVSAILFRFLFAAVPPGSEDLVRESFAVRGERPVHLLVLAVALSLWAASGLMMSLMEGFQAVYRLPGGRPFVEQRAVAILLVLIAAAPVLLASTLLVLGDRIEHWILFALGLAPAGERLRGSVLVASVAVRYAIALAAIVIAAAGLFYVGPNRRQQWKHVLPGALVSTALWLVATVLFAWYVRNIANYNLMYGGIGAVIALLVWMYVLAVVALFGCAYCAERERSLLATGAPARPADASTRG